MIRARLIAAAALVALTAGVAWSGPAGAATEGTPATGGIYTVAASALADGETFMIADGVHAPTVFEFDKDSPGSVAPGNVAVALGAGDSATTVAAKIRMAVNAVGESLGVSAPGVNGALVSLVNDVVGGAGNEPISEAVADNAFTVTGMSGGAAAPVLDPIGDKSVDEGRQLQFTVSGTDPDGDAVSYSASGLPAGASFDAASGTFTWTPGFDRAGSYPDVHFEVSDGALTDSEDIAITVGNVDRGDPPADDAPSGGAPPAATPVVAQPLPLPVPGNIATGVGGVVRATTTTRLSAKRTRRAVKARGAVAPSQPGRRVTVTMYRKRQGRFRMLFTKHPVLDAASGFRARFRRPRHGRCRITARFPGHAGATPSSATKTFRC